MRNGWRPETLAVRRAFPDAPADYLANVDRYLAALATADLLSRHTSIYCGIGYRSDIILADLLHPADASYALTPVSAPVFQANRGYWDDATGRGYTGAINHDSYPGLAQNDAHLSMFAMAGTRNNAATVGFGDAVGDAFIVPCRASTDVARARINDDTSFDSGTITTVAGGRLVNRSASGARQFSVNGVVAVSDTTASTGRGAAPLKILFGGSSATPLAQTVALVTVGGSVLGKEMAMFEAQRGFIRRSPIQGVSI